MTPLILCFFKKVGYVIWAIVIFSFLEMSKAALLDLLWENLLLDRFARKHHGGLRHSGDCQPDVCLDG
jgi:hypothetical protein